MASNEFEKIQRLLEDIKKLMILELINNGEVQSKDIAAILGVDPAVISRLVPRKKR